MWEAIAAGLVSKAAEQGISGAFNTAFLRRQNKIALGQQEELNKIETNQLMRNTAASVQALKNANLNPALMGGPSTSGNASGAANSSPNLSSGEVIQYIQALQQNKLNDAQIKNLEEQNKVIREDARSRRIENDRNEAEDETYDFLMLKNGNVANFEKDGYYLSRKFNKGDHEAILAFNGYMRDSSQLAYEILKNKVDSEVLTEQQANGIIKYIAKIPKMEFERLYQGIENAKTDNERNKILLRNLRAMPNIFNEIDNIADGELSVKQIVKLIAGVTIFSPGMK